MTDVRASGCATELFALAGHPDDPAWFILNPANATLEMHGAQMLVYEGQEFVVGARGPAAQPLHREPACSITWSGWKPDSAPPPPPAGGGPFDRASAARALGAVRLTDCITLGGPSGPGHVSVTFSPQGQAVTVVVDEPPYEGTPAGDCVAKRFATVRVPPFVGDSNVAVGKSFEIENTLPEHE